MERIAAIQRDLDLISKTIELCGQTLNVSKTKTIHFSLAPITPIPKNLYLNGQQIERTECLTYLGVDFDIRLNMKCHVRKVVTKSRQLMGATLNTLQKHKQFYMIQRVWLGIIRPNMEYSLWLIQGKNVDSDRKLERVQLTAARAALNEYNDDTSLLQKLGWQSIRKLAWSQRVRIMHSYVHKRAVMPKSVFRLKSSGTSKTRQKLHNLQIECLVKGASSSGSKSGFRQMCEQWNILDHNFVHMSRSQFSKITRT